MKSKILGLVVAGLMFAAAPASAMVLSVVGGADSTVAANFNPVGFPGGVSTGDPIKVFNTSFSGGLQLSGPGSAVLKYQYFGAEAGFLNFFSAGGVFSSQTSAINDTILTPTAAGFVPFSFVTSGSGDSATNNGLFSPGLSIAFANLGNNSFLIMFNDAGPDLDRDDLVVKVSVSQVPLPAAVWLLLSAVVGLFAFSRVRRTGTQSV